jgi:two-component system phosphate regulon response regulator PhoB
MSRNYTLLVVEDEPAVSEMLTGFLEQNGFVVHAVATAAAARTALHEEEAIHLVLLDWMLPDHSGLELLKSIKAGNETRRIPVLMVTARSEEEDLVSGFDAGADDYITKPFSTRELLARIRAALRRHYRHPDEEILHLGPIVLDPLAHRVLIDDEPLHLGPTEYRLLKLFMSNPERVYSRDQLLKRAWREATHIDQRTVDVHIRRLRKALGVHGLDGVIQTVRGAGYRASARSLSNLG